MGRAQSTRLPAGGDGGSWEREEDAPAQFPAFEQPALTISHDDWSPR